MSEVECPQVDLEGKSFRELHNLGGKCYGMQDYSSAVLHFSKASEVGVKELGDQLHDNLGEIYLLYGKSLLELARQEGDPLGDNVPKEVAVGEEAEEEEDEGDEGEDGEKDEGEKGKGEGEEGKTDKKGKNEEGKDEEGKDEEGKDDEENKDEEDDDDDDGDENELDNSKNEQLEGIELNGEKISSQNSGTDEKEEEPSDLQLAWEVLELAKIIFTKREDKGKTYLADTLITLGEISMESENVQSAIADIKDAVSILDTLEDKHNRMLAEAYYKLGMAIAMENKIEEAIEYYNKSKEVLENRIKDLESSERGVHKREVEDMRKIVPEIEEKVADLRTFREEQLKNPPEDSRMVSVGDAEKKANDISHLVKRKRTSDGDASSSNPPKKPSLD